MFMKVFWIYLTIHIVTVYTDESLEEDIGCVPPWVQVHRSCMEFELKTFRTWQDARSECIKKGGDLVVISDSQELQKFKPELSGRITSHSLLNWWVGLNYSGEPDDVWKWVDGSVHHRGLVRWAPGEPDNGRYNDGSQEQEECAVYNYQNVLKDELCTLEKPYVCEEIRLSPIITKVTTTMTTPTPVTRPTSTPKTDKPESTTTSTTVKTTTTTQSNTTTPTNYNNLTTVSSPSSNITAKITTRDSKDSITSVYTTTVPIPSSSLSSNGSSTHKPQSTEPSKGTQQTTTEKYTTLSTTVSSELTMEMSGERHRDEFRGCYAVNFESSCPPTEALGIFWPRTNPGETRIVDCESGQATWKCDKNPTCWRGEPNVEMCTSENIQNLMNQLDEVLTDEDNSDAVIEFTEELATVFESDSVISEQDIYQSSKLLADVAKAKPNNASTAKAIIKNVVQSGSSLIGQEKRSTWSQMKRENKKMIASSLLNSMETVTNKIMQSLDEPTVERFVEDSMEVELHVLDPSTIVDVGRVEIYKGQRDSFFVTPETLRTYSSNGLTRVVVINYDSIAELLPPEDYRRDDGITQEIISQVLSVSIGGREDGTTLDEPITYTFNTANRVKNNQWRQMCSFWNFSMGFTGAWSQRGCFLMNYNETHTTCQCNHLTNFAILMDIHQTPISTTHATTLSYITYVGIIVSIICLFLSWITFICLGVRFSESSVQGERNSIHKHLVFCLFVAEVLFLAGIERTEHKLACSLIAGFLHYFFLASFTWMFIEGIQILLMLVQVFDAAKSRMKYYYILGYGSPLVIVGVSAGIFHEGYGTDQYCWLTSERFFIWSFAGPIAFILLVNLMILIYAMAAVCKHAEYVFSKEKSSANLKGWIQGALALEVLLGLTWVFGYFYISGQLIVMAYLFTVFNSLQGLFIFVFHCILNKKVRKEYERFIEYRPSSTATSNTNSKTANGSTGPNTGSYALASTRKPSTGFSDVTNERKQSSSFA